MRTSSLLGAQRPTASSRSGSRFSREARAALRRARKRKRFARPADEPARATESRP